MLFVDSSKHMFFRYKTVHLDFDRLNSFLRKLYQFSVASRLEQNLLPGCNHCRKYSIVKFPFYFEVFVFKFSFPKHMGHTFDSKLFQDNLLIKPTDSLFFKASKILCLVGYF